MVKTLMFIGLAVFMALVTSQIMMTLFAQVTQEIASKF